MKKLFVVLLLLVCIVAAHAQERAVAGTDAPPHRWYCEGGSASRSNASSQVVPAANLVDDWQLNLEHPLLADALVWDHNIFLLVSRPKDRAVIKIIDVETGLVVRQSSEFNCDPGARMGVWGRRIAVQTKSREISLWSIGSRKVTRGMRIVSPDPIQDFLFYAGSIYTTAGDALVAYTLGYSRPRWRNESLFRGGIAIADGQIFAADYFGYKCTLKSYDLTTGALSSSAIILHAADVPDPEHAHPGSLQLGDKLAVARLANSLKNSQKDWMQKGVILSRSANPLSATKLAESWLVSPAITYDGRAIFRGKSRRVENAVVMFSQRRRAFRPLFTAGERAELLVGPTAHVIRCGKTAWINDCAFLLDDHRMLRQGGEKVRAAIPMKGGMLLTAADAKSLRALRDPAYNADRSDRFVGRNEGTLADGRAVFRNGSTIQGQFEFSCAEDRLSRVLRQDKKRDYKLSEVLYIEDAEGRVVLAPNESLLLVGMKRLDDLDLAEFYQGLAKDALRSNKPDLVDRLIDEAGTYGADEKEAGKLRKRLLSLKKRKNARVKHKIVTRVKQTERDKLAEVDERLWTRLESLPADSSIKLKVKILRILFDQIPQHHKGERLVNSWLPKEVQTAKLNDPGSWLDFVVAANQTKIKIIAPPSAGTKPKTWDEGILLSTQQRWRKDVVGIRSKRLFVISPLKNPSQVVRCLALGETVCDALEKIFADGKNKRSRPKPLVIHLFPTKDSYVEFGLKRGMSNVAATLGYYTTGENITRLFLPDSEEQLESMRGTFVHELTHHWTFARCPLLSASEMSRSTFGSKGVWIVEGFADMMSDFTYNPELRTYDTENPRARALDLVANARDEQLLDWNILLETAHQGLMKFSTQPRRELLVKLRWNVGGAIPLSKMNVFYSQSAAVCHFLMRAENGKYRPALLDFVEAFYKGRPDSWSTEKNLGMTAKKLGEKVREFARTETRKKVNRKSR